MATAKKSNKYQMKGLTSLAQLANRYGDQIDDKEFDYLPLDKIYSKEQPRKSFEKIEELAESMKSIGQLQPIVVNPDGNGKYVIEQGERRYRAAQLAGMDRIYAVISETRDDEEPTDRTIRQLAENIQRDDMKLYELAKTVHSVLSSGMTVRELSKRLGKKEPYISALNTVSDLPPVLEELAEGQHIKDPVSLRRLKVMYSDNPEAVESQIRAWEEAAVRNAEEGAPVDFVVTRAQVTAFANEMKRAAQASSAVEGEHQPADPDSAFDKVREGGDDEVEPEDIEEPEDKEDDKKEDLPEGYVKCTNADFRVFVKLKGRRKGYLTPGLVPPPGKLSVVLESGETIEVDSSEARISHIGTVRNARK